MTKIRLALACAVFLSAGTALPETSARAEISGPILSEFVYNVLDQHPALEAAQAQLDAAIARARSQGRPLYNPEIELDYEDAEVRTKQIGLAQTFDWSGKRGARTDVARAQIEIARASLDIAKKSLLTELLISLADYQARQDLFRINEQRVQLSTDFFALAQRRNNAGDLPKTSFLTARLALADAKIEKNSTAGNLSKAQENLTAIIGDSRATWPKFTRLPPKIAPTVDGVQIEELPELRRAQIEAQTFRSRIKVAKRDRIPDPTLGVRYGQEGTEDLLGFRFSVPVPVWNSGGADVDAARADFLSSERTYNELLRRAKARLGASQRRYSAALSAWQEWQNDGATPLEQQRDLLQRLWQAGEIDAVAYLVQLDQTFDTEISAAELRGRLWSTWFLWLDASGDTAKWVENIE